MQKQPKTFYSKVDDVKIALTPKAIRPEIFQESASEPEVPASRGLRLPSKLIFGLAAIVLLSLSGIAFYSLSVNRPGFIHLQAVVASDQNTLTLAQANPGTNQGLQFDLQAADARLVIVSSFLSRYNSPLKPHEHYAEELVKAADRYGLDYRLLPAIMMQESNLCKSSDPKLYNCLGFGIHKNGTLGFDSYEEGFDRAARELKERYVDIGLTTPEQIMKKYTPSSNGSWADSVNQWIAEMEHNDRQKGIASTTDADLTQYNPLSSGDK